MIENLTFKKISEYKFLKEKIDETNKEVKSIRIRTHAAENNIASGMGIMREIQVNANWIIKKLDEMIEIKERQNERIHQISEKVNKLTFDIIDIKSKHLEEKIAEKTNHINKFKSFIFSGKFISIVGWTLFLCMYYADKFSFAGHVDNARKIING